MSESFLNTEQQLLAVQSARQFFRIGAPLLFIFIIPFWWRSGFFIPFTLELGAFLIGTVLLEIFYTRSIRVCMIITTATIGSVFVLGFFQFGPNLGMGFIGLAWVLYFINIFGALWAPCITVTLITLGMGVLDITGFTPQWGFNYEIEDWLRMSTTVAIISLSVGIILHRVNLSLVQARQNEALAIKQHTESEKALMQSQRLEGIGRLAGGVAHDFNNALSVIVTGIAGLKTATDETQRLRLLANIEQAAEAAKATTEQLLALSKQGSAPEQACKPKQALQSMLPNIRRLFPENISLETELSDTANIELSSGKLQQLILNLCLNARDAMPHGGVISIACHETDGKVHIGVKDTGIGMDASVIEQATGAFYTTNEKGTGLGLAMVKEVTETAGGEVRISSEVGRGASVHLYFPPAIEIHQENRVERRQSNLSNIASRKRLLLVEDNLELRQMYAEVLSMSGFIVKAAGSITEAIQIISDHELDLLLTDAVLPDGDASSVIRIFRSHNKGPVLVCSGYLDSEELLKDIAKKEYRFIQKPFPLRSLINILNEMTQSR